MAEEKKTFSTYFHDIIRGLIKLFPRARLVFVAFFNKELKSSFVKTHSAIKICLTVLKDMSRVNDSNLYKIDKNL